jgi:glycosyltransferase involved in cell wall biosynthesis
MKVCILSVQVPFITGGAEQLARGLKQQLRKRRCEVETVLLPFKWYPPERLLDCMLMARLTDLQEVNGTKIDKVIALKFPAYFAPHSDKVCWILHQHRQAYDFYGTELSDLWQSNEGRAVAAEIKRWDDCFLPQSAGLYTISKTVTDRLLRFNGLEAQTLYPPPLNHSNFHCDGWENYILYPGRFDPIKRQHLLFDALANAPKNIQLIFCGQPDSTYGAELQQRIETSPYRSRVKVLGRISEEEKIDLYANCLAVYNGVYDEDYGYATLEAFFSGKPVITHTDSGGPLEFVIHEDNGLITEPNPVSLGNAISVLAENPACARTMGSNGRESLKLHNISWDYVVETLLKS